MPVKSSVAWSSGFVLSLLGVFAFSTSTGNSIMDIINMEKVEKLLAERRENGTPYDQDKRLLMQNRIDGEETLLGAEEDDEDEEEGVAPEDPLEQETPRGLISKHTVQQNRHRSASSSIHGYDKGRPHRNQKQNLTGMPDFASIFADLTGARAEKVLKSDNSPMLITKKEYLKKDWCKTEPMVQKIREDGCLTRTIVNRFCYGQCNSFYIPKNAPKRRRNRKRPSADEEGDGNLTFRSCGFCKPKKSSWILVTLRCPAAVPYFRKKKVHRIKQCKCIAENVAP